ncbi:MAG: DNA translocase FtsK [Lachnospiraceae bacterium]|nr:DNA translocase FtsK [Lachnospiraceae bacterium]
MLGNFSLTGAFGKVVNGFLFGLFGLTQYIFPILLFIGVVYLISNDFSQKALTRFITGTVLFLDLGMLSQAIFNKSYTKSGMDSLFAFAKENHVGGGLLGGGLYKLFSGIVGPIATVILIIIIGIICVVLLTQKSFIGGVKKGSKQVYDRAGAERERRRELNEIKREKRERERAERERAEEDEYDPDEDRTLSGVDLGIFNNGEKAGGGIGGSISNAFKGFMEKVDNSTDYIEVEQERDIPPTGPVRETLVPGNYDQPEADGLNASYEEEEVQENILEKRREFVEEEKRKALEDSVIHLSSQEFTYDRPTKNQLESLKDIYKVDYDHSDAGRDEVVVVHEKDIEMPFDFTRKEDEEIDNAGYDNENNINGTVPNEYESEFSPINIEFTSEKPEQQDNTHTHKASFEVVNESEKFIPPDDFEVKFDEKEQAAPGTVIAFPMNGLQQPEETESLHVVEPEADDHPAYAPLYGSESSESEALQDGAPQPEETYDPAYMQGREKRIIERAGDEAEEPAGALKEEKIEKEYIFPPIELLKAGSVQSVDSQMELQETARKLHDTLASFNVNVNITNISQGPTVTRYEMQLEQGVKVARILSLADDIKLNLAATDVRIEAPIPGKAAVGIEVPNKKNSTVMLRDLIDSPEFRESTSKVSFAVGKDIAGANIVFDIAKMPHLLIAGATGSGKSVCINTIIMSILYHAKPDEVKLIMIDPKVVELSVYNGLPHLMTPVVTDPQKAAGALHWGVVEMTRRYELFAKYKVRDMKSYNRLAKEENARNGNEIRYDAEGDEIPPMEIMPQILIIVDELADLMMVAKSEVETNICRLTQLARAAGIHLIIATQRPSVDVITGLIKANVPSRIAFMVSQGVDSRTILDMNGAEKLLGKGDMLFAPQGYTKPERLQGPFVSDEEVGAVVDFIINENGSDPALESGGSDIEKAIEEAAQNSGSKKEQSTNEPETVEDDRDQYFADAGRFIIEKQKASIGILQRMFRIGFNRAARIMDQLAAAGVVSEEEGTKARQILMTMDEFEQYLSSQ